MRALDARKLLEDLDEFFTRLEEKALDLAVWAQREPDGDIEVLKQIARIEALRSLKTEIASEARITKEADSDKSPFA